MKLPTLAFFLLFGFAAADFFNDIDGKTVLLNYGNYYILPANGTGRGLELGPDRFTIVQASKGDGLPVKFFAPSGVLGIYSGLYLNIEFIKPPSHVPLPARWTIPGEYSSEKEKEHIPVKVSDEIRLVGPFQVRESGDDYKLVYCEELTITESKCIDLGIEVDPQENRRLVLKDGEPFKVRFKDAGSSKRSKERSIV